ncbi:MAG: group II intron reverse transcriptase/maturase [Spirochaetes bacterium]|nr:group II intron reverse transcriptase/maturase [Spirochaetota bacterium]
MENSQRARSGKPRIQPRGSTYVEPKVVSQGLQRVREAARRDSSLRFTCLLHHVTVELLREAYKALNPKAAPGVDGMTWSEYGKGLGERLRDLYGRVHRGGYRAQPSRRTYIYKDDGRLRPLGIAALEDKIVQLAVVWVLQAIYEEDFLGFSYGFRPGRGQHNALDAVWVAIVQRKVSWVLDADIRGFFGSIVHEWMIKFVEHRIGDKRIVRLIQKWLKAGVSEDGEWSSTVVGTPQGATVSPLLANIYLHYVLDLWVEAWRKRHARGEVYIVRYADDFVMGFQYRSDAEAFRHALEVRMCEFGLELNTEKTRLIEFGRFAAEDRAKRGEGKPETFDFLGFTHICARRRKDGRFTVWRKTIAKRLRRKVKEVTRELKRIRHSPVPEQGKWLRSVITGYYNYHAVPGNFRALNRFRKLLACAWLQALRRRSQKGSRLTWARMQKLLETWFPRAQILHPYPNQRLLRY